MAPKVVCVAEATLHRIRLRRRMAADGLETGMTYVGSVCTTPDLRNGYLVQRPDDPNRYVFVPRSNAAWIDREYFNGLERPAPG